VLGGPGILWMTLAKRWVALGNRLVDIAMTYEKADNLSNIWLALGRVRVDPPLGRVEK
jgi:hypothetical protein